jgi:2-polyprenyl-3-methyl-5-hydroxy-6-metoxy-1,4-benzoquinol methylase
MADNLDLEANAFDRQIVERVANGHIPDLRRAKPCHYFYNNPWREPEYVAIDFGDQFELICGALKILFPEAKKPLRILEVGCGPGHFSLELARAGHDVTGIDLSQQCINVAERFASEDPWKTERGPLRYLRLDFLSKSSVLGNGAFDVCLFIGALHHFRDQDAVMRNVSGALAPDGCVLAHEPTRDRMTKANAAISHLVRVLLSAGGGFFKDEGVPQTSPELKDAIQRICAEMQYEDGKGGKLQSVNDNEAGFKDMLVSSQS